MTTLLLDYFFRTSLILGIAFLAAGILRRQSASVRHLVWSAAMVAIVILPVLMVVMPSWESALSLTTITRFSPPVARIQEPAAVSQGIVQENFAVPPAAQSRMPASMLVWLLGSTFIAAVLLREMTRLARIAQKSEPFFDSRWFRMVSDMCGKIGLRRSVRLVQNRSVPMLVTWGALQPRILLPAGANQWTDLRVGAVLGHELAHVRRHDWFIQLVAELARTMYWFNPLVWIACNRLRQESERACDDAVLSLGYESTQYATELLELARMLKTCSCSWAPSLAMAHPSTLERRFSAMLNPRLDRRAINWKTALLVVLLGVCLTLPVAAMRAPLQAQGGKLFGRVYDPTGAAIRNATVSVFDPNINYRASTISDAAGRFDFPRVPAGLYEVQTAATGFEPFLIRSVIVEPNQEVNLNVLIVASNPGLAPAEPKRAPVPASVNNNQPPRLIKRVSPTYPPGARERNLTGAVVLDAVIGTDGTPKSLNVASTGVDPELAKAAVDAARQWRYEPALVNGQTAEAKTAITINFATPTSPSLESAPALRTSAAPTDAVSGDLPMPSRIRQGGAVQQAMLLYQVPPVYPEEAKALRITGIVILEALVGTDGAVSELRVVSGHPTLQQAAIDSVRQWRYKTTLLNGVPVEVLTTVTVNFSFQP